MHARYFAAGGSKFSANLVTNNMLAINFVCIFSKSKQRYHRGNL
ncbi:hypothetical protein HBA_0359 [Sodalis endosymbiont of Henestaris halophilus]|nr:hypothetical protein HBA_0359 [Sodalis endosymbiont of Henestaris halophilus]